MRYIELFAGVGGFRLGITRAIDYRPTSQAWGSQSVQENSADTSGEDGDRREHCSLCVFSNEWDAQAAKIYRKNFGEGLDTRDLATIPTSEIPNHELLVGGFPCQPFSHSGRGGGFNDTRGTLFFEIARILNDKRPRHLMLENVKGLLTHDSGKTFQRILGVLADLGYRVEWQVLNSTNFGVPQNRDRIFIIGHLGEKCRGQIFPLPKNDKSGVEAIRTEEGGEATNTLTTRSASGTNARGTYIVREATSTGFAVAEEGDSINLSVPNSKTRRGRVGKGVANTLDTGVNQAVVHKNTMRRLTPIECERLQGFPDNWTQGVSDSQRYKQMGNAVTVNVIQAIIESMIDHDHSANSH